MSETPDKISLRRTLRERLANMSEQERQEKSAAACSLITSAPEFKTARVVMLFLSTTHELDTAPIALRAWLDGKTVCVPKVSWDQRRMMPVEISSLGNENLQVTGPGIREPIAGKPLPLSLIDLVLVPGLGYSPEGLRIGRGMGFYDRFLGQSSFLGVSCGLAFEQQIVDSIPMASHDMPVSMLVTDTRIRRFAAYCVDC